MDTDLARHVATVGFKAMSELTNLMHLLQQHCSADEYEAYRKAIATVEAYISAEIIDRVYSAHPELEKEMEGKIKKYGVII